MLNFAKRSFARLAEYAGNGAPVAGFNEFIQFHKGEMSFPAQREANAAFTRAHKARKDVRMRRHHENQGQRFLSYLFFVERFLRWILPLKECSFTEEAALPRVPANALSARIRNGVVCSGSSRKSFSTCP